jgi:hypothetical protein
VRRRAPLVAAAALAAALLPAGTAQAHGVVGREDLPLPSWLFAWGAAVVLVVSFVALAALWPRPRLQHARERVVLRVPVALEVLAGALGVAIFAVGVAAGFAGVQTGTANLLPTLVYVALWVGVPVLSALVGDLFAAMSPWRAVARAAGWVAGRLGVAAPEPLAYPGRLGRWPAAVGLVAFAWLELAYTNRDDPSTLALLACAYAAVQLVGMALYGVEQWTRNADAFAVAFGLYARLAPLDWRDRRLRVRPPLSCAPPLVARAGTVAVLAAMIGTTTFDGFSQGTLWLGGQGSPTGAATWLADRFASLGLASEHALEAASTVGLVAVVLLVGGLFRLGIRGMRTVGEGHTEDELARGFVHTLIPIALAYLVAHYVSSLLFQGQALGYLVSDPLGDGSDLLGTSSWAIDYALVGATAIWYVQVAALVTGHVAGLVLAHDRALVLYRQPGDATRSQVWMLGVMVGFTCLGLWLLSAAA